MKPTNVKLYPSRDGKATRRARSVRLKEMPPENAPRFLTYPRCEYGTSFVDVHIQTDPRGAREIEFTGDRAQLRIHLGVLIEMRQVGKIRGILIVCSKD